MCSATRLEIGKQHIDMLSENAAIVAIQISRSRLMSQGASSCFTPVRLSLVTAANLFRTRTCYTVLNAIIFRHILVSTLWRFAKTTITMTEIFLVINPG